MRKIIIPLLAVLLLVGCRSRQEVVREVTIIETKDSISFVHDTAYFEIPTQTAEVVTHDSVSVLENDYAVSHVTVNKDGTISHQLATKPQNVPVPFEKPVETKTVTVYQDKEVKVPVPVEKGLSAWQKFRLDAFWWLLCACGVGIIVIFRKPIFVLIRRFIIRDVN